MEKSFKIYEADVLGRRSHIGMCRPKGQGFLRRFGLQTSLDFARFGLEWGYALRWNHSCVSMCSSYQFQINKKESVTGEFEMDFKKSFCCGFNLSNDDITSVLCKHVMLRFVTTSRSENRCGKWLFFLSETEGQYLENRATHPHLEFPGVPPWGGSRGIYVFCFPHPKQHHSFFSIHLLSSL